MKDLIKLGETSKMLGALVDIIQCDEIKYDNELDYYEYMHSLISTIKEKPIFDSKSWAELKEE